MALTKKLSTLEEQLSCDPAYVTKVSRQVFSSVSILRFQLESEKIITGVLTFLFRVEGIEPGLISMILIRPLISSYERSEVIVV